MVKEKKRYLLIKVEEEISKEKFESCLKDTFIKLFGIISFVLSGYKFIYFDEKNKIAIIKCNLDYLNKFYSSIFLLSNKEKLIQAYTLYTSGTLKKIREVLKNLYKEKV